MTSVDAFTFIYGDHGLRAQKELVRSYLTVSKDLIRVMRGSRLSIAVGGLLRAARRSIARAIEPSGEKIREPGMCRRAEHYYQQLDALRTLHLAVRKDLLAESRKHKEWKQLCGIPSIGPIRAPYCWALFAGFGTDQASSPISDDNRY